MTQLQETIDGYRVDLDTDMDGDGTTGCWIQKGQHSSSLEMLLATGELYKDGTDGIPVPQSTINEIEEWANENGY